MNTIQLLTCISIGFIWLAIGFGLVMIHDMKTSDNLRGAVRYATLMFLSVIIGFMINVYAIVLCEVA